MVLVEPEILPGHFGFCSWVIWFVGVWKGDPEVFTLESKPKKIIGWNKVGGRLQCKSWTPVSRDHGNQNKTCQGRLRGRPRGPQGYGNWIKTMWQRRGPFLVAIDIWCIWCISKGVAYVYVCIIEVAIAVLGLGLKSSEHHQTYYKRFSL